MGAGIGKIKNGMMGSRNGKSRFEYTEVLKKNSKKTRRKLGKKEVKEQSNKALETDSRS